MRDYQKDHRAYFEVEWAPCPFCGEDEGEINSEEPIYSAVLKQELTTRHFYVGCRSCSCEGPPGFTEEDAVRAWNTRSSQPLAQPRKAGHNT